MLNDFVEYTTYYTLSREKTSISCFSHTINILSVICIVILYLHNINDHQIPKRADETLYKSRDMS